MTEEEIIKLEMEKNRRFAAHGRAVYEIIYGRGK
jgi:hypothetical protein